MLCACNGLALPKIVLTLSKATSPDAATASPRRDTRKGVRFTNLMVTRIERTVLRAQQSFR